MFSRYVLSTHCVLGLEEILHFRGESWRQAGEGTGLAVHLVSVLSSPPAEGPPEPVQTSGGRLREVHRPSFGHTGADQQHWKARGKHLPVVETLLCASSP